MTFKSDIKLLMAVLFVFIISSCGTDSDPIPIEDAITESFDDLTVEQIDQLETPFEALLQTISPGGRVANHEISVEEVIALLEEFFQGSLVVEVEEDVERGLTVLKFQIKLNDEAFIEFSIVTEKGKILEIEGQAGPFDYDIDAGGNFVTLNEALQAALDEIEGGEIERWELEIEEDNKWEFEIHVVNDEGRWEIEIDAFSGKILKIKLKNKTRDEEKDFDGPKDEAPEDILAKALEIVPGEVVHSQKKERDNQDAWFIAIRTEGGALVKVQLNMDGAFVEAKGEERPFDYVVEPGGELMTFAAAKERLFSETDGDIHEWKLRQKERGADELWVYQFKVAQGDEKFEVKINAVTGEFLEFDREHEEDGVRHLPDDIIAIIQSMIDGEIVEAEVEDEHDRLAWEITVITADGSEVKFLIEKETGELVAIKGHEGSFDYEVTPGNDLLPLSAILEIVLDTGDEELFEWRLDFNDDQKWVYEVEIFANDKKIKIVLDATTGEILREDIKDDDPNDHEVPDEIIDFALELIDGDIADAIFKGEDVIFWKVKIETANGAHVYFGFNEEGELVNIEDPEGPFDYNVEPAMDLISFNAAKEIALDTGDEELKGWELEMDNEGNWFYKLFIVVNNEEITVKINAVTGEVF